MTQRAESSLCAAALAGAAAAGTVSAGAVAAGAVAAGTVAAGTVAAGTVAAGTVATGAAAAQAPRLDDPSQRSQRGFDAWMRAIAARTELALAAALAGSGAVPAALARGMGYAVLDGGKRVRPALVHAAGEVSGADAAVLDAPACAVEFIHAYSLVHDDLPCMDDDALRRGKPSVHVAFGEATAMLVGDALQALAFEVLASIARAGVLAGSAPRAAPGPGAARGAPGAGAVDVTVAELARAAGIGGMAGGQAIDLSVVGTMPDVAALEDMHRRKTGALLRASVRLGALAGERIDAASLAALDAYAQAVGLAFQVIDDILDVEGDSATIGKTAGKDSALNKPTFVSLLGVAESRRLAATLRERARDAIAPLGARAARLGELAELIVRRSA
ncbi:MAG: polyprenyl synthetase family protein [Burkholderiaceae bacterium]|nr:polyprenyl synthetase family protein [Burkholderiaceae bacterium]